MTKFNVSPIKCDNYLCKYRDVLSKCNCVKEKGELIINDMRKCLSYERKSKGLLINR